LTNTDFLESTTGIHVGYLNEIPIVNVYANLQDTRYGGIQDYNEFIFTGTKVVFTTGEITTIQAGGSLPKTVDVWGGDCIVSPHCFKVADSCYHVMNQKKAYGSGDNVTTLLPK